MTLNLANDMYMPLKRMKLKTSIRPIVAVLIFAALVFVGFNVADYSRFTRAVARATGLTEAELVTLGDYAKSITRETAGRPNETPPAFQHLKPINVSLYDGLSYASLYQLGQVHVQISITTSSNNQHIYLVTNSTGPQKIISLWHRNTQLAKELSPTNRLLTISQGTMHESIDWVILRDQIQVIDRSHDNDYRLASIPLAESDRVLIEEAIRSLPVDAHGKVYRNEGVIDGISLLISFTSDGNRGPDDIAVENTWPEFIDSLFAIVSRCLPKDYPINFKRILMEDEDVPQPPPTVRTLREWEAISYGRPKTPWWCVWRSLFNRNDSRD